MSTPQFETAQYAGTQKDACKRCGQPVRDSYYRVNGEIACAQCAEKARLDLPKDSHAAFSRALLFGAGGAIVGLILYAVFAIATGFVIGYAALAVGYIIAKAMKLGAKGAAGRRYQIAAALFTYAAVSMAAVPVDIHYVINQRQARAQTAVQQSQTDVSAAADQRPQSTSVNWGSLIWSLLFVGLASPFLELQQNPTSGLIGLVILYVGIQIAWKMMAGKPSAGVDGPFRIGAASSSGSTLQSS